MANKGFTILVSDRNKHVREFLKRELERDQYRVIVARTNDEIIKLLKTRDSIRLLILDPELPDLDKKTIFQKSQTDAYQIPIILHTYPAFSDSEAIPSPAMIMIEKSGNSIEKIKKIIADMHPGEKSRKVI